MCKHAHAAGGQHAPHASSLLINLPPHPPPTPGERAQTNHKRTRRLRLHAYTNSVGHRCTHMPTPSHVHNLDGMRVRCTTNTDIHNRKPWSLRAVEHRRMFRGVSPRPASLLAPCAADLPRGRSAVTWRLPLLDLAPLFHLNASNCSHVAAAVATVPIRNQTARFFQKKPTHSAKRPIASQLPAAFYCRNASVQSHHNMHTTATPFTFDTCHGSRGRRQQRGKQTAKETGRQQGGNRTPGSLPQPWRVWLKTLNERRRWGAPPYVSAQGTDGGEMV
jgi:hypothetical protein